jgi:hypothetical protein
VAGGPGFEPRPTESESAVLPLNYPPSVTPIQQFKALRRLFRTELTGEQSVNSGKLRLNLARSNTKDAVGRFTPKLPSAVLGLFARRCI